MSNQKPKKKNKGGRPSKYKPEYSEELIEFMSRERYRKEEYKKKEIITNGKKHVEVEYKYIPNDIPFLTEFARKIGISYKVMMNDWPKAHKDFRIAIEKAKELQKEFLIKNGTMGLYNPAFAIFTAKNITDMRDKVDVETKSEVEHTHKLDTKNVDEVLKLKQKYEAELEDIYKRKVIDIQPSDTEGK